MTLAENILILSKIKIKRSKNMELYDSKYVYFEWDDVLEGKDVFLEDYISALKDKVNNNLEAGKVMKDIGEDFPFYSITHGDRYTFAYYDPNYEVKKAYNEGKKLQWKCKDEEDWRDWDGDSSPFFLVEDCGSYELRVKPEVQVKPIEFSVYIVYACERPCFNIASKKYSSHCYQEGSFDDCNEWVAKHQKFLDIMYAWEKGKTIQYYDTCEQEWMDVENPLWNLEDKYRIKPEEKKVPFENKEELIRKWEAMNPGCKSRPDCANPMIWVKDSSGSYHITGYKDYTVIVNGKDVTFEQLFNKYTFLDGTVIGKRS